MTNTRYQEIMQALIAQRKRVTSSREAATQFINDAGIRHLIIDGTESGEGAVKKNANKKTPEKK